MYVYVCAEVGGVVLDLMNLEVADKTPHTHVQTQICASKLNQPTSNDFHMVTFLTNTNLHTRQLPSINLSQFPDLLFTSGSGLLSVSGI